MSKTEVQGKEIFIETASSFLDVLSHINTYILPENHDELPMLGWGGFVLQ